MKRNVGKLDRILRAAVGAPVLIILGLAVLDGVLSAIALVFAGVMLATAATGFCPPYALLGVSTCERRERKSRVLAQH